MKVLIADDDGLSRALLADILAELGHTVVTASNGAEAVELFSREAPEAVFLDFLMPKMSGLDALRAIRAVSRGTPVVLLTAISDRSLRSLEGAETPDAVVEKPPRAKTVERALARAAASAAQRGAQPAPRR